MSGENMTDLLSGGAIYEKTLDVSSGGGIRQVNDSISIEPVGEYDGARVDAHC